MSWLFFTVPLLAVVCSALDSRDLYPHTANAVSLERGDDISSEQIDLKTPVRFLTKSYQRAWVLSNGFVSFEGPDLYLREEIDGLPTSTAILAPFYADVDITQSGSILYEQTQDERLLDRAEATIREMFYRKDRPTSLLIVTWKDVPGYEQNENVGQGNTFQLVVITNGYWSYCLFHFPEGGINWYSSEGKYSNKQSVYGKSGVMFDIEGFRSDWYFPYSGSEQLRTLVSYSTKQSPGVYMYKIGGHDVNVIEYYVEGPQPTNEPRYTETSDQKDRGVDDFEEEQLITTTMKPNDRNTHEMECHSCKIAEVYEEGRCTELSSQVYSGSGNTTGTVNGKRLLHLQNQVSEVLHDGNLQLVLGSAGSNREQYSMLQELFPITAGFALIYPKGDGLGLATFIKHGSLTYQADMMFSSGERIRTLTRMRSAIVNRMLNFYIEMTIDGDLPNIPEGDEIRVPDYALEFRASGLNRLETGTSRIEYYVGSEQRHVDVYHYIEFDAGRVPSCDPLGNYRLEINGPNVYVTDNSIFFQHDTIIGSAENPRFDCSETDICSEYATCEFDDGKYECVCNEGYSGDGLDCEETGPTRFDCSSCHLDARCEYDVDNFAQRCVCRPGYTGNGRHCEVIAETTQPPHPCEAARCGQNAYCMPVNWYEHRCVCDDGYSGDGYNCVPDGHSVDVCAYAGCHQDAICRVNSRIEAECTCKEGYNGNGYRCVLLPEPDCRTDPSMCSSSATCVLQNGLYTCRCKLGYDGDGRQCTWTPPATAESLLYVHGLYLGEMPVNGQLQNGKGKQYAYDKDAFYVALAQDCETKEFYVSEVNTKAIYSLDRNTGEKKMITDDVDQVEGLAIDSSDKKLYVTDKTREEISVVDIKTGKKIVLIDEDAGYPRSIVIDSQAGYMYWTNWLPDNPSIERAELDGSNRQVLTRDVEFPNQMILDKQRQELCWVDAGKKSLECMSTDGSGHRVVNGNLQEDKKRTWPFGLAKVDTTYFFTDWGYKRQLRAVDENGYFETFDYGTTGGRKYNIMVVEKSCELHTSPCAYNNGGCAAICVPKPVNQRACLCPSNEPNCNNRSRKLKRRFFF